MLGFWNYLPSPDAGYMKETERMNHASQVRLLLEHLDPDGKDVTCLVDDDTDAVWEKWAHPLLAKKKRAGGTINSYLGSVESSSLSSLQTEESPRVCHIWTKIQSTYSSS